jgi:hypothetical protein
MFIIESKNGAAQYLAYGRVWTHVRSQALKFEARREANAALNNARTLTSSQIFRKAKVVEA